MRNTIKALWWGASLTALMLGCSTQGTTQPTPGTDGNPNSTTVGNPVIVDPNTGAVIDPNTGNVVTPPDSAADNNIPPVPPLPGGGGGTSVDTDNDGVPDSTDVAPGQPGATPLPTPTPLPGLTPSPF